MKKKKSAVSAFTIEHLNKMAGMLKVLAHPQRLRILEVLESFDDAPVHRIMKESGLAQAVVSFHLGLMKRVGLICDERKGHEVWYRIADSKCFTILECMRKKGAGQ